MGLATYLIAYGPGNLFGIDGYWEMPRADQRMALMGYRHFLYEPWHWPVFESHTMNVPYATSVAFADCIPLWALFNKLVATLVPPWEAFSVRAYLGLWHGLTYMLQACIGVALLRSLGHRSWREGIVIALVFVAVPAWIFRYGHPALSAHWVELWALSLYFRTPARSPGSRRLGVEKLAQLGIGALITPYHPAMSLPIFIASLLRSRDRRTIAIWLPLGFGVVAIAMWFAGYFASQVLTREWGFEVESTNMLSWLVPTHSGIVGDARWIANVMATEWQYEGIAYLGLGVLGLLALFLPEIKTLRGVIARHPYLFAVALAFWLFALSNRIYFGSHEIASYPIPPGPWRWITHQFRSPGRFVWVPMYVLIVFLLHWAFTRFSIGRRFAVLVVVAAVQLIDARGQWLGNPKPSAPVLDLDHWRRLIHAHDAVFIHPTYYCLPADAPGVLYDVSVEIAVLASERGLPINGSYTTRATRTCEPEIRAWPTLELQPKALYVLLPPMLAIADRFAASGGHCAAFEHGRVCSTEERTIEAISRGNPMTRSAPP